MTNNEYKKFIYDNAVSAIAIMKRIEMTDVVMDVILNGFIS